MGTKPVPQSGDGKRTQKVGRLLRMRAGSHSGSPPMARARLALIGLGISTEPNFGNGTCTTFGGQVWNQWVNSGTKFWGQVSYQLLGTEPVRKIWKLRFFLNFFLHFLFFWGQVWSPKLDWALAAQLGWESWKGYGLNILKCSWL